MSYAEFQEVEAVSPRVIQYEIAAVAELEAKLRQQDEARTYWEKLDREFWPWLGEQVELWQAKFGFWLLQKTRFAKEADDPYFRKALEHKTVNIDLQQIEGWLGQAVCDIYNKYGVQVGEVFIGTDLAPSFYGLIHSSLMFAEQSVQIDRIESRRNRFQVDGAKSFGRWKGIDIFFVPWMTGVMLAPPRRESAASL